LPDLPKAVVLLSGDLDSTTIMALAKVKNFAVNALTIRYGQRHVVEVDAARQIAAAAGVARHIVLDIDLTQFGGSALTANIAVPKGRSEGDMAAGIRVTYVPARNTVFLSLAPAWAEALGAFDIFIGVNALDYSGYPDCRPEFISAFERTARLATKAGVDGARPIRIHAPLIDLTKQAIIERGLALGVDYGATVSCYDPGPTGILCGHCDACQLRAKGFSAKPGLTTRHSRHRKDRGRWRPPPWRNRWPIRQLGGNR
jgi:7-cyano-7-deazaguanine synthase